MSHDIQTNWSLTKIRLEQFKWSGQSLASDIYKQVVNSSLSWTNGRAGLLSLMVSKFASTVTDHKELMSWLEVDARYKMIPQLIHEAPSHQGRLP